MQDMDLEKNTLVVFTSDNGHEMGAGTGSVYREGKRSLMVRN
jgi:arylsulfatase A-like enzyme